MNSYKLHRYTDQEEVARATATLISSNINSALEIKNRVQIALSGGSTPAKVYSLLGDIDLPWERVDIILGDERWVDPSDESSNSLMIRNTLLSKKFGIKANFYPVPTLEMGTPKKSARSFCEILEKICTKEPPSLDFILLGLGEDGHTASLFPNSEAVREKTDYVTVGQGKGLDRITLTAPFINATDKIMFLVTGVHKQMALKRLIDPFESEERTPAKLIRTESDIVIVADNQACSLL